MSQTTPASSTVDQPPTPRVFYGWWVAFALFCMLGTMSGLAFYNQSVLLEALTRERGFPVGQASLATTWFFAANGVAGLFVARAIDRFDPRWTISFGVVLASVALLLIGRVEQLWQLYAAFALFGCGFSAASMVPGTTLITRWFELRRPLALAVMTTGLSVGGIVLTPVAARLLLERGLRDGTPWIALLVVVCIAPLTLLLVRPDPASIGVRPDGEPGPPHEPEDPAVANDPKARSRLEGVPFALAWRSRFFFCVSTAFFFGLAAQVAGLAHQFNFIAQITSPEVARTGVSLLAAGSILGRLIASVVARSAPLRAMTVVLLLTQGTMILLFGRAHDRETLLLASFAFGLTVGSTLLMQPLIVAEAFGVRSYARVYSITSLVTAAGIALGPTLLGAIVQSGRSYSSAFAAMWLLSAAGAIAMVIAGPIQGPRRAAAAHEAAA